MSRNADIYSVPSFRLTLAPGSITQIGPFPRQLAASIKLLAGGTLEIGGYQTDAAELAGITALVGSIAQATGNTFGTMYPLSTNEVYSMNNSGAYYLYASSATCVVAIASGKSGN